MLFDSQLIPSNSAVFGILLLYIFVRPVLEYFYDAKNLRKFPNQNAISGFSDFGLVWERLAAFRTAGLHEAHKKHPVIRIGPTSLSFRDVGAIKDIYGHSSTCLKGDMYRALQGSHANLVNVVDKRHHASKRKLLSNAFATRNLESWEYKVVDKVRRLFTQFDQAHDAANASGKEWAALDFQKWSNLFTIEAIADIGLSYTFGMLEAGNDLVTVRLENGDLVRYPFIKSLHGQNRPSSILVWPSAWYHVLHKLMGLVSSWFRSQYHDGERYGAIVHHLTLDRMARHDDADKLDDLFHSLMEDRAGCQLRLDVGELEAELNVMMDAGSETTSIALTHLMFNLLRNPEKLSKLRDEIDGCLHCDEVIPTFAKVRYLPYLKACIDENLRIFPSIPQGLPRKTPPGGAVIMDLWIAGSVTVSVPAYVAHRDPSVFPDPEAFYPERWLDGKEKDLQSCYIPFSTGARGCIGRNISYIEQFVLFASLLKRYDFQLEDEHFQLDREEGFVLWTGPLPIRLKRRNAQS